MPSIKKHQTGKRYSVREFREAVQKLSKLSNEIEKELDKYSESEMNDLITKTKITSLGLSAIDRELGRYVMRVEGRFLLSKLINFKMMLNIEYESRFMDSQEE